MWDFNPAEPHFDSLITSDILVSPSLVVDISFVLTIKVPERHQ